MSLTKPRITIFVLMRALPGWIALSRPERFHVVMKLLRDSALFSQPYFELVQIIPIIEDGFRQFEAQEAAS